MQDVRFATDSGVSAILQPISRCRRHSPAATPNALAANTSARARSAHRVGPYIHRLVDNSDDDVLVVARDGGGLRSLHGDRDGESRRCGCRACYDRREANDNPAYHARFAASFDGGLTVSPRVQVSAAPNDPKTQRDGEPFSVIGGDHRHALGSAVSIDPGIEHPALRGESRTIAGLRAHQCHSRAARWSLASRRGEP